MYILLRVCGDTYKSLCPMVGDSKCLNVCLPLRAGATHLCGRMCADDAHGVHHFLGKLHRPTWIQTEPKHIPSNPIPPNLLWS